MNAHIARPHPRTAVMPIIIPTSAWYKAQSAARDVPCACPYANVHKCHRFYASQHILGEAGMITTISASKTAELDLYWEPSGLVPVIAEDDTGITGQPGDWGAFSNFCPEVTFRYFRYYASFMAKYVDDIDRGSGHRQAQRDNLPDDWRYEWQLLFACHYLECSVYPQVHLFNQQHLAQPRQLFVQQINSKEIIMGDRYTVSGQTAAVGPHAKAEGNTFHQNWYQTASDLDFQGLATELATLRHSMRAQAIEIEHDQAVANIGAAEIAIKGQDGVRALEHLKAAGSWAFKVANEIGVNVAAAAIEKALSL